MKKLKVTNGLARDLVKRAIFLAWQACGGPSGYGFLRDRGPGMTEDQVWEATVQMRDYPGGNFRRGNVDGATKGKVYADYVFGRMMKTGFSWDGNEVEYSDRPLRLDYESWCRVYPDTEALLSAAATSTGATIELSN